MVFLWLFLFFRFDAEELHVFGGGEWESIRAEPVVVFPFSADGVGKLEASSSPYDFDFLSLRGSYFHFWRISCLPVCRPFEV